MQIEQCIKIVPLREMASMNKYAVVFFSLVLMGIRSRLITCTIFPFQASASLYSVLVKV